jgi:hypothetical protein
MTVSQMTVGHQLMLSQTTVREMKVGQMNDGKMVVK